MVDFQTWVVPRTKDGKHELVFPQDFVQNHGIELRAALEGRVVLELLRIGESEPENVKKINRLYPLQFEQQYPIDKDPCSVLRRLSIPYVGKISPVRKVQRDDIELTEGDEFTSPYSPIFSWGGRHHFTPLTLDSFGLINKGGFFPSRFSEAIRYVPELAEYAHLQEQTTYEKLGLVVGELSSVEGSIEDVLSRAELTKLLKDVSRFHILQALSVSRIVLERPTDFDNGFEDCNLFGTDWKTTVYASVALKEQIARSAQALCMEYLSEVTYS